MRLVDQLSGAARTDALTGILNRRAFEERFEEELAAARRAGRPLTVAVGDLDGFKLVNDRLGHQAGDDALRRVTRELAKWKRRSDVNARIGGEEFALLLPGVDEEGAIALADRVRLGMQEVFATDSVPLTISFGIAVFPDQGDDAATLLRAADQALYAAKEMGRNRCVVFTERAGEVARRLARPGGRQRGDAARHGDRPGRGARHPRHRHRAALAAPSATTPTVMALEMGLGRRARGADRPRRPAARRRQDRHLRPRAHQARPARRPTSGRRCARTRRSARGCCPARAGRPAPLDPRPPRAPRRARLPLRPRAADEIPLEARILAVADAYEAMTADRVYRRALGEHAAREELLGRRRRAVRRRGGRGVPGGAGPRGAGAQLASAAEVALGDPPGGRLRGAHRHPRQRAAHAHAPRRPLRRSPPA